MKSFLDSLDNALFTFLMKNRDIMPLRFTKFIANFYTDARIRAYYWEKLGIVFGEHSYPNLGLKLTPNQSPICVHIGAHVSIAPNVTFICESSANNGVEINSYQYISERATKQKDIWVEDEVWIGANVTILPGVTLKRCSVIGAGSVVLNDTEPYGVYVGVPAHKIKDIRSSN